MRQNSFVMIRAYPWLRITVIGLPPMNTNLHKFGEVDLRVQPE